MTLLPAERVFNPLSEVGVAAAQTHVDCLVPLCQNGVLFVTYFKLLCTQ